MAFYNPNSLSSEELACPICFEDYKLNDAILSPKLLMCLHTYCVKCCEALKSYDGNIQCSICRVHHSNVDIADLMDNYVINEYLRKQQEISDSIFAAAEEAKLREAFEKEEQERRRLQEIEDRKLATAEEARLREEFEKEERAKRQQELENQRLEEERVASQLRDDVCLAEALRLENARLETDHLVAMSLQQEEQSLSQEDDVGLATNVELIDDEMLPDSSSRRSPNVHNDNVPVNKLDATYSLTNASTVSASTNDNNLKLPFKRMMDEIQSVTCRNAATNSVMETMDTGTRDAHTFNTIQRNSLNQIISETEEETDDDDEDDDIEDDEDESSSIDRFDESSDNHTYTLINDDDSKSEDSSESDDDSSEDDVFIPARDNTRPGSHCENSINLTSSDIEEDVIDLNSDEYSGVASCKTTSSSDSNGNVNNERWWQKLWRLGH